MATTQQVASANFILAMIVLFIISLPTILISGSWYKAVHNVVLTTEELAYENEIFGWSAD